MASKGRKKIIVTSEGEKPAEEFVKVSFRTNTVYGDRGIGFLPVSLVDVWHANGFIDKFAVKKTKRDGLGGDVKTERESLPVESSETDGLEAGESNSDN